MIVTTTAYKTSAGDCYESKEKAYNEEIQVLLKAVPKYDGERRALTAGQLKKLKDEVRAWLLMANETLGAAKKSPDDKKLLVVKDFEEYVIDVQIWVAKAQKFIEQMRDELDVEIKRSLAEQGG